MELWLQTHIFPYGYVVSLTFGSKISEMLMNTAPVSPSDVMKSWMVHLNEVKAAFSSIFGHEVVVNANVDL